MRNRLVHIYGNFCVFYQVKRAFLQTDSGKKTHTHKQQRHKKTANSLASNGKNPLVENKFENFGLQCVNVALSLIQMDSIYFIMQYSTVRFKIFNLSLLKWVNCQPTDIYLSRSLFPYKLRIKWKKNSNNNTKSAHIEKRKSMEESCKQAIETVCKTPSLVVTSVF